MAETSPSAPETFNVASRRTSLFNDDWRFLPADPAQAEQIIFPDHEWRALTLPHDWSVEGEFERVGNASGTGYLPGGTGWYRKHFTLSPGTRGQRVFLRFEGVYRHSHVWLNGAYLGERPNGYIDFEYDLTAHLRAPGEENVVAVRVERENVADSRWYPGTGIYRDTWLTVTGAVHVVRHGVFVTTPVVDDERAEVNSSCEVRNDSGSDVTVTVTATVFDTGGRAVSRGGATHAIAAGQEWVFPLYHPVDRPRRWDVDDPFLYQIVHTVTVAGRVTDETSTPLGIRSAHFDANQGFFLNDRHLLLKGVCIHHDAGNLGAAVPRAVLARRLRLLKGIGVNAIRCSHNPMADDLYALCDELGLLVMDEAFDEWEIGKRKWVEGRNVGTAGRYGYSADFETWAVHDVEDMVRRSRRHPCVALYSIGNEIDYPTDPYVHPTSQKVEHFQHDPAQALMNRLAVVAPALIAAVKRQDPTRPVTMALSNAAAANAIGLASMLDVAGYNYQEAAYAADHARFPNRVICGSENGHGAEKWQAVCDQPFVCGQFLWTGFDFLGEADRWPRHGSSAGLFDTAGFPKTRALHREALWSEKPVLHLCVFRGGLPRNEHAEESHWNEIAGESGPATVVAFTNLEEVNLTLNGRSCGRALPVQGAARWEVPWEAGRLEVSGPSAGGTLRAAVESTGPPAKLHLALDRATLIADGRDVVHVTISLLDAEGRRGTDADREITVRGDVSLRLLAVESGDLCDSTRPQSDTRLTRRGQALAILQAGHQKGNATITVSAPGLSDSTAVVEVIDLPLPNLG